MSVTLLDSSAGGRAGPAPADRFGCPLKIDDSYFDCRMDLEGSPLEPGQTRTVVVDFLNPTVVVPLLQMGVDYPLRELRVIGHARLVEIVSE